MLKKNLMYINFMNAIDLVDTNNFNKRKKS